MHLCTNLACKCFHLCVLRVQRHVYKEQGLIWCLEVQKCTIESERSFVESLGCISAHLSVTEVELSDWGSKVHN